MLNDTQTQLSQGGVRLYIHSLSVSCPINLTKLKLMKETIVELNLFYLVLSGFFSIHQALTWAGGDITDLPALGRVRGVTPHSMVTIRVPVVSLDTRH